MSLRPDRLHATAAHRLARGAPAVARAALLALVAGCAARSAPDRPAPIDGQTSDGTPAHIIGFGSSAKMDLTGTASSAEVRTTALPAPPAAVWAVLPEAYASLGIPVTTLLSDRWQIGSPNFRPGRRVGRESLLRVIECGNVDGNPIAERYEVTLDVLSEVRPAEGGGSTLATRVFGTAVPPRSNTGNAVPCSSRGRLEQAVVNAVTTLLAR